MLGLPNPYLIGGTAFIVATLSGLLWLEHERLKTFHAEVAAQEASISIYKTQVDQLSGLATANAEKAARYQAQVKELQAEAATVRESLRVAQEKAAALKGQVRAKAENKALQPGIRAAIEGIYGG